MIVAVIVTYNPQIDVLDAEYQSVIKQVDKIVYVDNCSINRDSITKWAKEIMCSSFIWLDENEGLGTAQNSGIKKALDEGATHIVLFDQDSIVDSTFITNLLESERKALANNINVGLTGPVYKSYDNNYAYPVWSVENDKIVKILQDSFNDFREVTHIIASGCLIRRETIEEVGLMREDLFLGYIDFEYCFRAARHGFKAIVVKDACMRHQMGDKQIIIHGRKIGIYSPFRRYFDCRNTLLIQREQVFPKAFRKYYLGLIWGKVIISIIYGPQRMKQLKYCIKGFYDGILGHYGKCTLKICS